MRRGLERRSAALHANANNGRRGAALRCMQVLLGLVSLVGLALPGSAHAVECTAAQVAAIETALREAPLHTEVPENAPAGAAAQSEQRCDLSQAKTVRTILAACQPAPAQVVIYLGAGRCLQQAGYSQEAVRTLRAYLAASDSTVTPEHARERRDRVRRWLADLGDQAPPTAQMILTSNLRGPLVSHLQDYPEGLTLDRGENRIGQPPGLRQISLSLPGFNRVELKVDLIDGETSRAEVDWRQHVTPRYAGLLPRWDDFAKSNLTPAGYYARRQRPASVVLSALLVGGGGALIGVCAANVNASCDAGWKQGLAYGFGALLVISGAVGVLSSLAMPLETMPPPGLTHFGGEKF